MTPGVNYIASISSSIEDQNGNFLDCFGSKGVDDNCEWNFKAGSSSAVPPAPSIINPQSGTFTNDNTPNIAGTTIGNLKIEVFDGSNSLGTTTASSGLWSLTPSQLSDGSHTLTATAEDTNTGKKSPKSSPVSFTIDTQKPTVTSTNPPTPPPPVTDFPTGKNITAKFNEVMRSSSINSQTFLLKFTSNNTNVPGTVSLSL